MTIVLVGETSVLLHTKESQAVELALNTFEDLVREGKITGFRNKVECNLSNEIKEILLKASEQDLKDANFRYSIVEPWLRGQPIEDNKIPKRTFRDWKAKYLQAQQKYGYGYSNRQGS
ncbi:hypothetical protein H6G97_47405 [Nostoc flagelliforme FACHB-838]|uniref:Transposase n=1 Tax=Nostoc flagelliforme FACHB-838 TaxID=2692904 RepID=A0ABR8E5W8_9NOSO|nr:hypothetical protein [Nostoc flagelliforme FACHB-838]